MIYDYNKIVINFDINHCKGLVTIILIDKESGNDNLTFI